MFTLLLFDGQLTMIINSVQPSLETSMAEDVRLCVHYKKNTHTHNTHNTTHTELYEGNIYEEKVTPVTATYKISEYQI